MRDIEYRGVSWEAEWVYGDLIKGERQYISTPELFKDAVVSLSGRVSTKIIPIDPESVGQFTGLLDAKGNKVFEGDVIYLAGYGDYICEFPFIDLYEANFEGDIGEIKGNIYQHPHLIKGDE